MKKALLLGALALGLGAMAQAAVGNLQSGFGKIIQEQNVTVVKKALKKGEALKRHNHAGDTVIFTLLQGKMKVQLNDSEAYDVAVGDVLAFDGENYIQGEAQEDSVIFVNLVPQTNAAEASHHQHEHHQHSH